LIRINLLPKVTRRRLPGRTLLEVALPLIALGVVFLLWAVITAQNAGLQRDIEAADKELKDRPPPWRACWNSTGRSPRCASEKGWSATC
jgi:nitrogen fixation-related uncharacterized protein